MTTTPTRELRVALIHEVFHGPGRDERLQSTLRDARQQGATLAILPEIPLDPWVPHNATPSPDDAENPEGPRHQTLAAAAREAGIGVVGGAITVDATSQRRHNRALVFDASGQEIASYDKLHLPDEAGFRETAHYEVGHRLPSRIDAFDVPLAVQLCSDMYRPQVSQFLGAMGVEIIAAPRATEATTWKRWCAMLVSNAVTSCAFVVSVNRPRPEFGVNLGSPSAVLSPDGTVVAETTDPLTVVTLRSDVIAKAKQDYPGYLPVRSDLYAQCWETAHATSKS